MGAAANNLIRSDSSSGGAGSSGAAERSNGAERAGAGTYGSGNSSSATAPQLRSDKARRAWVEVRARAHVCERVCERECARMRVSVSVRACV